MSALKLSKLQLEKMLGGLVVETADLEDSFARAVWSLITEPGDTFAGAIIGCLGAKHALAAELNQSDVKSYIAKLKQNGIDGESEGRFKNLGAVLADARARWQPRLKLQQVENMLNIAKTYKAQLITPESEYWPTGFEVLKSGQPHCLWIRGQLKTLQRANYSLAVVGSRMATSYGQWVTTEIISAAAMENIAIISGGAYGIDAVAHQSALALGLPTVAIMAGGVDRLYPSGNSELLSRVIHDGAVVAEQAPGGNPTRWRFLQRNRLIAAMSNATVVVEAGKRSGAINTANHAEEFSRPLAVVPGPISSPASAGCNDLIRHDKTRVVRSVSDVIELVTGRAEPELFEESLGALETRALDAMTGRAANESSIAMKAGLTARELITALGQLQLLGLVAQGDRGWRKVT